MAKWGEGDPRWIVEDRPDATNVNNWHWSEKDATLWSQDKLKSLLIGIVIEGKAGKCHTVEVITCNGEATVNNRKGKLIFFYEWDIKLKWKGSPLKSSRSKDPEASSDSEGEEEVEYSGEIDIPNMSEENDVDEVDVVITVKKNNSEAQGLKELMHKEAPAIIRNKLMEYLRCLKEEYSRNLILPTRDSSPALAQSQKQNSSPNTSSTTLSALGGGSASRLSGSPIGCRIYTAKINLTESFLASVEDLYDALTDKKLIEAFTQSKAMVEPRKGGSYCIMNGYITGEFLECTKPSKIVLKWRLKTWPDGHFSTVTIELKQAMTSAELTLNQTEVPEAECARTKDGWHQNIFQRIKSTFGYGSQLF